MSTADPLLDNQIHSQISDCGMQPIANRFTDIFVLYLERDFTVVNVDIIILEEMFAARMVQAVFCSSYVRVREQEKKLHSIQIHALFTCIRGLVTMYANKYNHCTWVL
jgi:hypothetical protein